MHLSSKYYYYIDQYLNVNFNRFNWCQCSIFNTCKYYIRICNTTYIHKAKFNEIFKYITLRIPNECQMKKNK